jgi:hypothetical protein
MVSTEKMWWPIGKKMQFCEKWVLSYLVRIDWLKLSHTIDPAMKIISKPSVRLAADVHPLHKTSKTHQSLLPRMWLTLFIQTKKHQQKTFTKLQLLLPSVQLVFAPNFQIFSIHATTLSSKISTQDFHTSKPKPMGTKTPKMWHERRLLPGSQYHEKELETIWINLTKSWPIQVSKNWQQPFVTEKITAQCRLTKTFLANNLIL